MNAVTMFQVVKWCSEQIKRTMQKNPIAPEDPAQYFKDKVDVTCLYHVFILRGYTTRIYNVPIPRGSWLCHVVLSRVA